MERKIIAFAHLPHLDKGNYLPKTIAGIYAIQDGDKTEFFYVQTIPCREPHYFNAERDMVCIQRIGSNVDLRYLFFEEPGFLERELMDISSYPIYVGDEHIRRSPEEIKKNMGYEAGLDWTRGSAILNGNFLGIICRDEIIYHKKLFGWLNRKKPRVRYMFDRESHGGYWVSGETSLILEYHGITVENYAWNEVN